MAVCFNNIDLNSLKMAITPKQVGAHEEYTQYVELCIF
jgi:hypothetical protein